MKYGTLFLSIVVLMISTISYASSNRMPKLVQGCGSCHGLNGISKDNATPNLAGQKKEYLEFTLKAYRSKERRGGKAIIMHMMAAPLKDKDIVNLSLFYSSYGK